MKEMVRQRMRNLNIEKRKQVTKGPFQIVVAYTIILQKRKNNFCYARIAVSPFLPPTVYMILLRLFQRGRLKSFLHLLRAQNSSCQRCQLGFFLHIIISEYRFTSVSESLLCLIRFLYELPKEGLQANIEKFMEGRVSEGDWFDVFKKLHIVSYTSETRNSIKKNFNSCICTKIIQLNKKIIYFRWTYALNQCQRRYQKYYCVFR